MSMTDSEAAQKFLASLPRLTADAAFEFRCHPDVACFNACCADLNLVLAPYDVLRLRHALGLSSRELLRRYARVAVDPTTSFPQLMLAMRDDEGSTCPLVERSGCTVYRDRPAACRTYPLGRGARLDDAGVVRVEYVLLREAHCQGFAAGRGWTPSSWADDQELQEYTESSERYLRLTSRWTQGGRPLTREQFGIALLALYRLDELPQLVAARAATAPGATRDADPAVPADDEARLAFAFDWLERELMG